MLLLLSTTGKRKHRKRKKYHKSGVYQNVIPVAGVSQAIFVLEADISAKDTDLQKEGHDSSRKSLWLRGRLRAEVRLFGHQVLIDLAVLHEVAVRAGVHDLALLHDDDGGGTLYRGQSVGDDDASATGARSVQRLLDHLHAKQTHTS